MKSLYFRAVMAKTLIKNGQVLLAEPFMLDPFFRRSVVLLCEHHDQGSMGFILNKSIDVKLNDLVSEFPSFDADVFYGGPVQTDTLHYIHNVGDLLEDSLPICRGVWWGGDFDKLKLLASASLIMPENIRFFVGYAGWSSGQLDEEMESGSWMTANMDPNYVFKANPQGLWSQVMYNKGNLYEVLSELPEDVCWN